MTFKTKLRQIWENPLHPVWILLACLEIEVVVRCYDRFILHGTALWGWARWARLPLPQFWAQDIHRMLWGGYVDAGGIRVGEAISAFNGTLVRGAWKPEHTFVIVSMILALIVAPSLFLWGVKARKKWMAEKPSGRSSIRILGAIAIGGYMTFIALLLPVKVAMESWTIWQHMKADSYANAVRDAVTESVSALGFQAQQLRLMPEKKGGGPWVKGPGGITLQDLEPVLPHLERGIWAPGVTASIQYVLEVDSPDSLTLWGVADQHFGTTFKNIDGGSGKIQVHAGVTPSQVALMVDN